MLLFFLWQDNNWILDITTVYNSADTVISAHNRSSFTSTSVSITRHVFRDFTHKNLPISAAINIYNHYMSEVDIEN